MNPGTGDVYWADPLDGKIYLNNTDLIGGLAEPMDVALDLYAGKVYWTHRGDGTIHRADLDGTDIEELVTGLDNPQGISLSLVRDVAIDIKPGSDPNSINLGSNGVVPVAIFSTEDFDATTVDPLTVTLGQAAVRLRGRGVPMASFEDINQDDLLDLVLHVETQALQLTEDDVEAWLEGTTFAGEPIAGMDTVRIVGGAVPEPATLGIFALGGLALLRRRGKSR